MIQVLGRLERRKWNDHDRRRSVGLFLEAQHGTRYAVAPSLQVTGGKETGMCESGHLPSNAHSSTAVTEKRNKDPEQGEKAVCGHTVLYHTAGTRKQASPNHTDDSQKPGRVAEKIKGHPTRYHFRRGLRLANSTIFVQAYLCM